MAEIMDLEIEGEETTPEPPWDTEGVVEGVVEETPPVILPDHKGQTRDDLGEFASPTHFLTGEAGTGKTYAARWYIQRDPNFGVLCATTGIASINLGAGVPTIHSLLGFGNTQSAEDAYASGTMLRKLRQVGDQGVRWLIIDEVSMMHKKVLQSIVMALDDYNETYSGRTPLGLMILGDMCQLPPVPDKLIGPGGKYVLSKSGKEVNEPTPWAFDADCWDERFECEGGITKLTQNHRQSNVEFISGLNAIRRGDGKLGVELLKASGVQFKMLRQPDFDGTTIVATNEEVGRYNKIALTKVEGAQFELSASRWCAKQYEPSEWKNVLDKAVFKVNALVMLLQNDPSQIKRYVNGDLAHVVAVHREQIGVPAEAPIDFSFKREAEVHTVEVKLLRTGENVFIRKITRPTYQLNEPDMDYISPGPNKDKIRKDVVPGMRRQVWIMGELEYFPLRLAYASTTYKSQGLTLDKVQIDPAAHFFGSPQQAYVALSRCRTPEGLVIIGGERQLIDRVKTDPKLARWL